MKRFIQSAIATTVLLTLFGATAGSALALNPPKNTQPPILGGYQQFEAPREGEVFPSVQGSWEGEVTKYTPQWMRCNAGGAECVAVSSLYPRRYVPVEADVGHTIKFAETAYNEAGQATAYSEATLVVKSALTPVFAPSPTSSNPLLVSGTASGVNFTTSGFSATCNREELIGEFTDSHDGSAVVAFKECSHAPTSFTSERLRMELGWIGSGKMGFRLYPENAGDIFASSFTFPLSGEKLHDGVIGTLTPYQSKTTKFSVSYAQSAGVQEDSCFANTFKCANLFTSSSGKVGASGGSLSLTTSRSIEITAGP